MGYKDVIDRHMRWLSTVEGEDAPVANASRESDALAFVLTVDEDAHVIEAGEGGSYEQAGRWLSGTVDPSDIGLAIDDVVLFGGTRWRLFDLRRERMRGGAVVSLTIRLLQLET